MTGRALGAVFVLVFVTACDRGKAAPSDTPVPQQTATAAGGSAPTCQRTGHWSECTVRIRLEQSGLAPQSGTDKLGDLPTLDVKPITLTLGSAGVAFYLFTDTVSRRAAAVSLDTVRYIAQTRPLSIKSETTLIQNDNVLVLLFSKNEHQRERVSDAITAGPPQP